jgi:hypothetical protein
MSGVILLLTAPARAELTTQQVERVAANVAAKLSATCLQTAYDDTKSFAACQAAYRISSPLPFAKAVAWGGEQPNLRIAKKSLTELQSWVFQFLYMPLFNFTGRYAIGRDMRENVSFITVEAYFRNSLPPGDYPYPFWHSADKWNAYETANQLKFWLDANGKIFLVTRSAGGTEEHRGAYAHVTPPVFDGKWQWVDADGKLEPQASLFSNRYSANNPSLPALDKAYRDFALTIRDGTCLSCHTPVNKAEVNRLILLQTPVHASGAIDDVLKQVRNGDMPQDDLGLKKDIDPKLRIAILISGVAFQTALRKADKWEVEQHH